MASSLDWGVRLFWIGLLRAPLGLAHSIQPGWAAPVSHGCVNNTSPTIVCHMTADTRQDRDPVLAEMTTKELLRFGRQLTELAAEYDRLGREARDRRCAIVDELNRHRDYHADPEDPRSGRRIAALASTWGGMRFQSLRASVQDWWDKHDIDHSPDDRPILTDRDIQDIEERFAGGESKRSIAGDYGIARATVAKLVKEIEAAKNAAAKAAAEAAVEAVANLEHRIKTGTDPIKEPTA